MDHDPSGNTNESLASDPTRRFSNRVADYVRHRPAYPRELIECLTREFGLKPHHVIADIGSGTGILTRMLLDNGNRVFAVEPNEAMRKAAQQQLGDNPNFVSIAGSAEATGLPDAGVDWITAAQAFHWFDVDKARIEARRILRPDGRAALIWNDRKLDTPFLRAYEQFLQEFGTDFQAIRHEAAQTDGRLERFFGGPELQWPAPDMNLPSPAPAAVVGYIRRSFDNQQILDEEGLRGRTLSASYMPGEGHARRAEMLSALHRLFEEHQTESRVTLTYETHLYVGTL